MQINVKEVFERWLQLNAVERAEFELLQEGHLMAAGSEYVPVKRTRGRPKGSKNRTLGEPSSNEAVAAG